MSFLVPVQRETVSFFGTVLAASKQTLVSERISVPFKTLKITSSFALNTARTMKLRYFLSPDAAAPTTQAPNGINILSSVGQVDYLVGDNEQKTIEHEVRSNTGGAYLKVYAENTDVNPHTIDTQITIDLLAEEVI